MLSSPAGGPTLLRVELPYEGKPVTRPTNWGGQDGAFWAANDLRYDALLAPLTRHLLPAADIRPDDRVLDVGCGCGNTTRLAGRAARDGWALGVDLSGPMLATARQRAAEAGLTNVRYERGDAQRTPFDTVDLVLSQLGVMFFDDPVEAFTNLHRSLAPGGRLAFVCWQAFELNEGRVLRREALSRYVTVPPPRVTGALSFAEPARLREVLTAAGFGDIELTDVREPLVVGSTAEAATAFDLGDPTVREWLTEAGPAAAARATEALREAYAARETPDGVVLGSAAWLVTAAAHI
ncbi:MAG: methyltransferase domain-containing protein [Actinophytocola sp.]|nr:methyltransferase domain-containing protein [Actinophytocola sp.]